MSQAKRLHDLLSDGKPHRTDEIMRVVYGDEHMGICRIGARIYDLRRKQGLDIASWSDEVRPSLTWYQLVMPPMPEPVSQRTFASEVQPTLFHMRPTE